MVIIHLHGITICYHSTFVRTQRKLKIPTLSNSVGTGASQTQKNYQQTHFYSPYTWDVSPTSSFSSRPLNTRRNLSIVARQVKYCSVEIIQQLPRSSALTHKLDVTFLHPYSVSSALHVTADWYGWAYYNEWLLNYPIVYRCGRSIANPNTGGGHCQNVGGTCMRRFDLCRFFFWLVRPLYMTCLLWAQTQLLEGHNSRSLLWIC